MKLSPDHKRSDFKIKSIRIIQPDLQAKEIQIIDVKEIYDRRRYNISREALYFKRSGIQCFFLQNHTGSLRRKRKMGITGLQTYDSSNAYNNAATGRKSSSDDKNATISDFIKKFGEARQITAQELKEDKDWRDMTDSEWGKLLSGFDKYIDTVKEQIKEMEEKQKKAAQKAAVKAAPDQRTTAASSAALHAAAGGSVDAATAQGEDKENQTGADGEPAHEKNWTKNLQTDDQTILRVAKRAQEMESMAIAKYQEAMAKYREEIKKNTPAEEDENHVLTKEEALQKLTESFEDHAKSLEGRTKQQDQSAQMLEDAIRRSSVWKNSSQRAQQFLAAQDKKKENPENLPEHFSENVIKAGAMFRDKFVKNGQENNVSIQNLLSDISLW